jgi:hypothetical protein
LLEKYLPYEDMSNGRFPNKEYFWGIAFSIKKEWSNHFYNNIILLREQNPQ